MRKIILMHIIVCYALLSSAQVVDLDSIVYEKMISWRKVRAVMNSEDSLFMSESEVTLGRAKISFLEKIKRDSDGSISMLSKKDISGGVLTTYVSLIEKEEYFFGGIGWKVNNYKSDPVNNGILIISKIDGKIYWVTFYSMVLPFELDQSGDKIFWINSIHEVDENLISKRIYRFVDGICTSVSDVYADNRGYIENIKLVNGRGPKFSLLDFAALDKIYKHIVGSHDLLKGELFLDTVPRCYYYSF